MLPYLGHEDHQGLITRATRVHFAQAGSGHSPWPRHGAGPPDNERRGDLHGPSVRMRQVDRKTIARDGRVPASMPQLVDQRTQKRRGGQLAVVQHIIGMQQTARQPQLQTKSGA